MKIYSLVEVRLILFQLGCRDDGGANEVRQEPNETPSQ